MTYKKARRWYLNKMTVHLITIEVCIVCVAVGVVHAQRLLLDMLQHTCLVRHDAWLVESRLAIDQQHIAVNQMAVDFDTRGGQQQLGLASALHGRQLVQFDNTAVGQLDLIGT